MKNHCPSPGSDLHTRWDDLAEAAARPRPTWADPGSGGHLGEITAFLLTPLH